MTPLLPTQNRGLRLTRDPWVHLSLVYVFFVFFRLFCLLPKVPHRLHLKILRAGVECFRVSVLVEASSVTSRTQSERQFGSLRSSPQKGGGKRGIGKTVTKNRVAIPPTSYRGLSAPSGPSVPGSVPESVPANGGVRRSVQKVSESVPPPPECLGHLFDTPETLSGHFVDTPEPWPFSGTLSGTLGPKGPEDSCSWSAGSQQKRLKKVAKWLPKGDRTEKSDLPLFAYPLLRHLDLRSWHH